MSKSRARLLAELLNAAGRVKKDKSDLAGADSIIDLDTLPTITNAKLEHSSISIAGHTLSLGGSVSLNTGDITEHTDYKYYTDARVRAAISVDGSLSYNSTTGVLSYTTPTTIASLSNHDTADLAEGTNLYFTNARARGAISVSGDLAYNSSTGVVSFTERTDAEVRGLVSAGGNLSYNSTTGVFSYTTPTTIASLSNHDTDDLAEGTNLYFTNARARGAISASGSLSYNSSTGVISYTQPTNISTFTNDSSYITNATASLDASKITGGTLNYARIPIPANGDWWNNGYVRVQTDGVMEVGKYLDFHTADSGGGTDFDVRVTASSGAIDIDGDLTVDGITASGAVTWSGGSSTNANTAYGWGNHASQGYITNSTASLNADKITAGTLATARLPRLLNFGSIADLDSAWTSSGSSISGGLEIWRYSSSASNIPVSYDNANGLLNWFTHPSGGTASYGKQIATANNSAIYFRNVSNGSFGYWQRFFADNYHPNADKWTTARTLTLNGAVSGSASWDGSANVTLTTTVTTLADLALTGTPTAPTASAGTNTTQIATTAFVTTAVDNIVDAAPGTLNTLNELAAALGDDANFSTTVTNSIATKLPLAGGTMTGTLNMGANAITSTGTITSGAIDSSAHAVFGTTTIDPDSYSGKAVGFGTIADGSGWVARGLFIHGGGTGDAAAIGHNGSGLYFGIQNGSAANSMDTWLTVQPNKSTNFAAQLSVSGHGNSSQWNTAYGWGNHATAGYNNASNLSSGTLPSARLSGTYSEALNFSSPSLRLKGHMYFDEYSSGRHYVHFATSNSTNQVDWRIQTNGNNTTVHSWYHTLAHFRTPVKVTGSIDSDINGNNTSGGNIVLGATGNNASKWGSVVMRQYDSGTETEGYSLITGSVASGVNNVVIGGGLDEQNAASVIYFKAASNTSTRNGTEIARINTDGLDIRNNVLRMTGTTVIDASRNITAGTISSGNITSGAISSTGNTHYLGGIKIKAQAAGENYIAFRGTTGDSPGNYNHTYIGEHIYGGTEQSELLLAKFNDVEASAGSDRIRLQANNIVFDVWSSVITPGSQADLSTAAGTGTVTTAMKIRQNGDIEVGGSKFIDSSRNLTNIGTISSGAITSSGNIYTSSGNIYTSSGSVSATGSIGNLVTGSQGQQMERGDDSVTTLRFDANRWRLYAGANAGEMISAYENGTVVVAGTDSRPITIGVAGSINTKGNTGGWAMGLNFVGSSDTNHGGFGGLGGADNFSYYYIGAAYNNASNFRFYKDGSLNIGATTILDSSRNLSNIGTISSGAITSSEGIFGSTSGSNQGIQIKSGTGSNDYGRIRYYEGASTQRNTIHLFGRSWQGGSLAGHSTGAINLDGDYGVTFGAWNNIDAYVDGSGIHTSATRGYYVASTAVIDSSRRAAFGSISIDANAQVTIGSSASWRIRESGSDMYLMDPISSSNSRVLYLRNTGSGNLMHVDMYGNFRMNGNTVIDSSRNIYPYQIKASGGDDTPAGTQFSNVIKGQGTNRTIYFDGGSSSVSTWYGVGDNPYAAIDVVDGVLDVWVNPANGAWYNIADFTTSGLNISYGGLNVAGSTRIDSSGNFFVTDQIKIGDDAFIEDFDIANAVRIKGAQNNNIGYIAFGGQTATLGSNGDAALRYNGYVIANTNGTVNGQAGLLVGGTTVFDGSRRIQNASIDPYIGITEGSVQGNGLNPSELMHYSPGDANVLGDTKNFNVFAFKAPTMYRKASGTWSNNGTFPDLTDGRAAYAWGSNIIARSHDEYIFYFGNDLGYCFMSGFTFMHSTNGNSMTIYIETAPSGTSATAAPASGGWVTEISSGSVGSWPGSTTIKKNVNVGGSYRPLFRVRVVPNFSHASNAISWGQMIAKAGYGPVTRLFDWDGSRNVTFYNQVTASGGQIVAGTTNGGSLRVYDASQDVSNTTRGLFHDGNYTNGTYRHRWRKQDNGGGVPLYLDKSGGSSTFATIARFGSYSSNPQEFEVYGQARITSHLEIGVANTTATGTLHLHGSTADKTAELHCTNGNLHIDAETGHGIYMNWYGGTTGTYFGNGAAGQVASITGSGNITANGSVTSASLSCTGNLTVSSGNTTGGGIILADDGDICDLNDAYCSMRFSYGVRVYSGNRTGSVRHTLHSNGNFTATGNVTAYSDIRLKENITPITNAVEKVNQINGVTYNRTDLDDSEKRFAGVIAQEVEQVLPEVVDTDDQGIKNVAYGNMVGLLIEAIKEQSAQINAQQEQINQLTNMVNALKEKS